MKATDIKENEDSAARSWNGKKKEEVTKRGVRGQKWRQVEWKREQKEIEKRVRKKE